MIPLVPICALLAVLTDKTERERWGKLTPEQRAEELRLREVRALERTAQATEEIARKRLSIF